MKKKLLLIDGSSMAFRAFYSILDLNRFKNANGLHTNALFSFHRMFTAILEMEEPTHVLVAWDAGKTTFRTEMFREYKGGRSSAPSEFKEQMPYFNVLLDAFGIAHYRLDQYEADDIIGTLAKRAEADGYEVVVISGDRDLIQLASEAITVKITTKGVSELVAFTPTVFQETYGLDVSQMVDMKGLMGDSSDNYPGVTKVGEKTAVKLLQEYGSIEGIYEHVAEMKASKLKENLINDKDMAFLSKTLARIHTDAPIAVTVDETLRKPQDNAALLSFYKEMNFNTFAKALGGEVAVEDNAGIEVPSLTVQSVEELTQSHLTEATTVYIEFLDENYHVAEPIAIAVGNERTVAVTTMEQAVASPDFRDWLSDDTIAKVTFDVKALMVMANRYGLTVAGVTQDISLMGYLLDTNVTIKEVADITQSQGIATVQTNEAFYGKGVKRIVPEIATLHQHVATKAQALTLLAPILTAQLQQHEQYDLYETMELPLASVLARMEIQGITTNRDRLVEMGVEFDERLAAIEARIYEQAGEAFNINSPKQLGVILFEKMGLPAAKKTKTGYSTAVDVLEKLAHQAPIVADILEYRQLAKLKSTYVEGLQAFIQADGKIHTRYVQNLTQTGRLSSADPNLQNIPIRTPEGRRIRYAFLPAHEGWKILSSDYSQIELRVLAHIANDAHMIQAFKDGMDIHTSTAMRVFGVTNPEDVTSDMRRQAKAVNFGIVYGISDYGLSQNLNISRKRAKEFIDRYLSEFSGVAQFMKDIVAQAREDGYVETLFHRRRYLPDIHASNFNLRSFAERTAMNSPIQGTAADILKLAMIELDREMQDRGFEAKMLLQVHDELIFEVPEAELASLQSLVEEVMENAVALHVPLKADSNVGDSWYEAK